MTPLGVEQQRLAQALLSTPARARCLARALAKDQDVSRRVKATLTYLAEENG